MNVLFIITIHGSVKVMQLAGKELSIVLLEISLINVQKEQNLLSLGRLSQMSHFCTEMMRLSFVSIINIYI